MTTIVPVILCGGSGTRLWPLSRESMPKQFLNLVGDHTLLQNTALRAMSVSGAAPEHVVTVTLGSLKREVISQLNDVDPSLTQHVLGEPLARNTAGAVAYAAQYIWQTFGADTVMWVLPADHHIADEPALKASFEQALRASADDHLVTFGITPSRPETGYGYIKLGAKSDAGEFYAVDSFVEKPNLETAKSYLEAGNYLWNSGMFLFQTGTLLENFRWHASEILEIIQGALKGNPAALRNISAEQYAKLPSEPFDVAIMEKSTRIAVVPSDPAWSDIGSWTSLWEILDKDENGNSVSGKVRLHDSHNCLVQAQDRLVACAGLKDLIVVETPDSILITSKTHTDSMKVLVTELKKASAAEVLESTQETRPWGTFKILNRAKNYKIKETTIQPGHMQSLQLHNHRSEYWTILDGEATITVDNVEYVVRPGETMSATEKVPHRIANFGNRPLRLIEVQHGNYLGEDDVVRLDDKYGRGAANA